MAQRCTSADTSINSKKLPAAYNKLIFNNGDTVLDYGCGKYTDHIKNKMNDLGCQWYGYDKFNQPVDVNNIAMKRMDIGYDIGICSNVLNVIDDDETIKDIIHDMKDSCNKAIFFIYEGNKSGTGKITKKDCWQRNQRTTEYVEMMEDMGYNPIRKGNMIII